MAFIEIHGPCRIQGGLTVQGSKNAVLPMMAASVLNRGITVLENGLHADVYALEIIIPVAFRVNTYNTHLFRTWLVGKALSQEKRQTYVMFIQNGKAGYC